MPELPEAESARAVIERAALGRRIVGVDDSDPHVCRPHQPGELRGALVGGTLRAAHRRGKSLWCDVDTGVVLGVNQVDRRFGNLTAWHVHLRSTTTNSST